MEYADYTGKWAELGTKLSKMLFLELSSLEEDMIEQVRKQLNRGELKPTFRDLMYISIAVEKAWQQADRARERVETAPKARRRTTDRNAFIGGLVTPALYLN